MRGAPRPPWTDPIFDVFQGAEVSDPPLYERAGEVRVACAAHDAGGTGLLIHQDAHSGNLLITDDGRIVGIGTSPSGAPRGYLLTPLAY